MEWVQEFAMGWHGLIRMVEEVDTGLFGFRCIK